jgi:hypothetical protein
MTEDEFGDWEETSEGEFVGRSRISFEHALTLCADGAHKKHPGRPAKVRYEVTLGTNPPLSEWRVIITPGGG